MMPQVTHQCAMLKLRQNVIPAGPCDHFGWAILGLFLIYFWSFQTNNTIFNKLMRNNVHPVSAILTHYLLIMSILH